MSTKKELIKQVFDKAERESGKTTKNGLSEYLVIKLDEKVGLRISERTLIRYYDAYIVETGSQNAIEVDSHILNKLSQYLSYTCFEHFSNPNEFILDKRGGGQIHRPMALMEDIGRIIEGGLHINIQNIIKVSDFIRNNKGMSLGIMGMLIASGSLTYFNGYAEKKDHMYWKNDEYKLTSASDRNPKHKVIPLDSIQFKYFKKINRPDTLYVDNAMNNVWYSKHENKVDFFTMDGVNPDNGKDLSPVSVIILKKYAGKNNNKLSLNNTHSK